MLPFDNVTLTEVVNKRRPVATPIKDQLFTATRQLATETAQIDVIQGPEGLMVAISREAESPKTKRRSVSTQTVTIPRFSEHDLITASDQIKYRAPGVVNGGEAFEQLVVDKLDTLRERIDRTTEFMCVRAIQGQVVDGGDNVIATYPVMAPETLNFSVGDNANDAFDDAAIQISRALGRDPNGLVAWAGKDAYQAIRRNQAVREMLAGTAAGVTIIQTGRLNLLGGLEIRRLIATYVDDDGNEHPFLGDDEVIITAADAQFRMYHGPCSGEGGRLVLRPFYAQQSEKDDPPSTKIRVESNPLPVVNRPEAIWRGTQTA